MVTQTLTPTPHMYRDSFSAKLNELKVARRKKNKKSVWAAPSRSTPITLVLPEHLKATLLFHLLITLDFSGYQLYESEQIAERLFMFVFVLGAELQASREETWRLRSLIWLALVLVAIRTGQQHRWVPLCPKLGFISPEVFSKSHFNLSYMCFSSSLFQYSVNSIFFYSVLVVMDKAGPTCSILSISGCVAPKAIDRQLWGKNRI